MNSIQFLVKVCPDNQYYDECSHALIELSKDEVDELNRQVQLVKSMSPLLLRDLTEIRLSSGNATFIDMGDPADFNIEEEEFEAAMDGGFWFVEGPKIDVDEQLEVQACAEIIAIRKDGQIYWKGWEKHTGQGLSTYSMSIDDLTSRFE